MDVCSKYAAKKLSLGCPILNEFMNGGLLCQGVNEIVGQSGSGKSQLGMQLTLTVQAPIQHGGLGGSAIYVCTEGAFPIKRLNQLIQERQQAGVSIGTLDRVMIENAEDIDSLFNVVEHRVPVLIRNFNAKLLVIDSVAAVFRCEFSGSQAIERAKKLYKLGDILHRLNVKFGLVVVVINQMSGIMSSDGQEVSIPSLGLPWSNVITSRFQLSRTEDIVGQVPSDERIPSFSLIKRKMKVLISPNLPPNICHFVVDLSGVRGIKIL